MPGLASELFTVRKCAVSMWRVFASMHAPSFHYTERKQMSLIYGTIGIWKDCMDVVNCIW